MEFTELEIPVPEPLVEECVALWDRVFGGRHGDAARPILLGEETNHNHDWLYVATDGSQLVGTAHLTIPCSRPELGGLGEVSVDPQFRRSGIATTLCGRARERFVSSGGKAVFLGTVNSEARRIYHRLGWRKLASATVMAMVDGERTPEEFLVDHFRAAGAPATTVVVPGTADDRIPMIPLLLQPHDWHVLDTNAGHVSTRYAVQDWCMSLYPHYEELRGKGGNWFALRTTEGRLVGLASVACYGDCMRVDAMTHPRYIQRWEDLLVAAMGWSREQSVSSIEAFVAAVDEDKRARFEALGLRVDGEATGHRFPGLDASVLRLLA